MKYAIYKGKVGLFAMRYVEKLEDCTALIGGRLVKEEDLPIVINRYGGRHSFHEELEQDFVKIVETDGKAPVFSFQERFPKNPATFEFGWISPDGDAYACNYQEHEECARAISDNFGYSSSRSEDDTLSELGWLELYREYNGEYDGMKKVYQKKDATQAQKNTLCKYGYYDLAR